MKEFDNPETYSREPYRRAFQILRGYLDDFLRGLEEGSRAGDELSGEARSVVFIGVGGSGIVGDAVSAALPGVRIRVHRDYSPPRLEGGELVVAVSYSGETAETLSSLLKALEKDVRVAAITSDGRLEKLAEKKGFPIVRVREGIPARYAFPQMFGAALGILGVRVSEKLVEDSRDWQRKVWEDNPTEENPAKKAASMIPGRIPIIYGYSGGGVAGYRLKCQLNENAKLFAHFAEVPEALHNDVEAIPRKALLIFPRLGGEPESIGEAYRVLAEKVERYVELRAGDRDGGLGELLELFMLVDYVSLYTSILTEADPLKLNLIPSMRRENKINREVLKRVDEILE